MSALPAESRLPGGDRYRGRANAAGELDDGDLDVAQDRHDGVANALHPETLQFDHESRFLLRLIDLMSTSSVKTALAAAARDTAGVYTTLQVSVTRSDRSPTAARTVAGWSTSRHRAPSDPCPTI